MGLKKIIYEKRTLDKKQPVRTTKVESEVKGKRSRSINHWGEQNDRRFIGKRTTITVREGGKAYSRRLFSKPQSTCMRGRKKSKRRNKRTKRRR